MKRVRLVSASAASLLMLSLPAHSEDLADALWHALHAGRATPIQLTHGPYFGGEHRLKPLIESVIRNQRYVCDEAISIRGMGPFERGRYAEVRCTGDGAEFVYRLELWSDHATYTVRPWISGIDDG